MTEPRRSAQLSDAAGVSLIEIMFVLVIVSIGILALSGVQTTSTKDVDYTNRRTRAVAVAQTRLEIDRSLGYTLAVSDTGQTDGFNYLGRVDSVDVDLHRVTMTVSWTEKGVPDSVRLITLLSAR
jgi:Tfp pilus assembly protein PilV